MGDNILRIVKQHSYLGIELSHDLEWKHHISNITSKASRILGLLQRHLHDCPPSTKQTAYMSLVRPRLEYCASIWDPYTKVGKNAVEKIQRKAARFVTGNYKREASVSDMLRKLQWQCLENRRAVSRLTFLYKATKNLVAFQDDKLPESSSRSTRGSVPGSSFISIIAKKNCYKYSLIPRTIPEWNLLPLSIQQAKTIDSFKSALSSIDITDLIDRAHLNTGEI
ncbi:uncharacterized protein LOC144444422 [Glandiceps talaboti]